MINIQTQLARRALEILAIPKGRNKLLLDIGCGSGISGNVLGAHDHAWVGLDISKAMLEVAMEREVEGDVIHSDMGHGFGFRPGMFDGAISISAIQWLCSAEKSSQNPWKRCNKFFQSLYACLVKGARCAFQFYPSSPQQAEMITNAALKNGFTGGLIVDFPNSKKAKKFFLFLMAGYSDEIQKDAEKAIMLPKARTEGEDYSDVSDSSDSDEEMASGSSEEEDQSGDSDESDERIKVAGKRDSMLTKRIQKHKPIGRFKANGNRKSKEWILQKKQR